MVFRKRTRLFSGTRLLIITSYLISSYHRHTAPAPTTKSHIEPALEILDWQPNTPPRIAIAATSLANTNTRAINLWSTYASRSGHELHIQRTPVVRGFANPLIWLHHVIASELMKDTGDRAEWIVFIDPSIILPSNPNISVAHFLPPSTIPSDPSLTFIGTKLNSHDMSVDTSMFYIRVSSLSPRMLTLAMAAVYLQPGRNWGEDVAGTALVEVLAREGYRDKVVWVPREWFRGRGGDGVFAKIDVRDRGLGLLTKARVLDEVEVAIKDGKMDVKGEVVPSRREVEAFWGLVGQARSVLDAAKDKKEEVREEMEGLRDVVELRTWDIRTLIGAVERLKEKLGLGELMGFRSEVG